MHVRAPCTEWDTYDGVQVNVHVSWFTTEEPYMCECVTMVLSMFWDAVCVRLQVVMHPARCTWSVSSVHRAHFVVCYCCHTQRRDHAGLRGACHHVQDAYRMYSVLARGPYVALSHKHMCWALQRVREEYDVPKTSAPIWLLSIRRAVLKNEPPVNMRRYASGRHENRPTAVLSIAHLHHHKLCHHKYGCKTP